MFTAAAFTALILALRGRGARFGGAVDGDDLAADSMFSAEQIPVMNGTVTRLRKQDRAPLHREAHQPAEHVDASRLPAGQLTDQCRPAAA